MSVIRVEEFGGNSISRAEKALAGIPGAAEKAMKNAMSRAVSALRSKSTKMIQERYAISSANLRANENISVRYTYQSGAQAFVSFRGNKIPLFRYNGASPSGPEQDASRTVRAIVGGEWRMVHPGAAASGHQLRGTSPSRFSDAFVARMSSGHTGIFERTGGASASGNDAIREIMGSSVPQMLGSSQVEERLANETSRKFEERLEHEVARILNGW